jgi:N-acetylglutamate synthase-like GNAT family acetyltransferase
MEWTKDDFIVTTDKKRIDVTYVHWFLSHSYWAAGIPVETVQRSIDASMCFSVIYLNHQVGFARMITDKATFGYLADVFIDENFRGRGLSKWLIEVILNHPDLQGLRRLMLATRDAHSLYAQFGFTALTNTDRWMHIHNRDVYQQPKE